MSKISHCDICQCDIKGPLRAHEATKKHLANAGKGTEEPPQNEIKETKKQHDMKAVPSMEELLGDTPDEQTEGDDESVFSVYTETFLADLENDHFTDGDNKQSNELNELKALRTKTAIENERKKLNRLAEQEQKNALKHKPEDTAEELELLGKEKRVLLAKLQMYKSMFKAELKAVKFRVKKEATVEELRAILVELEAIVSINGAEAFCLDVIYGSIQMIEGVSSRTENYDVSGLVECLKANEQLSRLCRFLFIKYYTFSAIPPELQMVFIVMVSAVSCARVNQSKKAGLRQQQHST